MYKALLVYKKNGLAAIKEMQLADDINPRDEHMVLSSLRIKLAMRFAQVMTAYFYNYETKRWSALKTGPRDVSKLRVRDLKVAPKFIEFHLFLAGIEL